MWRMERLRTNRKGWLRGSGKALKSLGTGSPLVASKKYYSQAVAKALCLFSLEKPHRNRCCEVTIVTGSDAVRPRRAWILASAQPNSGRGPRPFVPHQSGRGRDLRSRKYKMI